MIKPNTLTVFRIILAIVLCFVLWQASSYPAYFACFLLFVTAALTDLWDGYMARKLNLITDFGKIADPIADKILILGTLFTLAFRGVYSVWWVIPVALREIVVTAVRLRRLSQKHVIAAEWSGKIKTVIQLVTIGVAFVVFVLHARGGSFYTVTHGLLIFFLIATNLIAFYSGFEFFQRLQQTR